MDKSRLGLIVAVSVFVISMLAIILYSSIGIHPFEVETCITYRGRTSCGTAAGATREQALTGAARVACSSISSGMTQSIACDDTPPDSVRWIREQ